MFTFVHFSLSKRWHDYSLVKLLKLNGKIENPHFSLCEPNENTQKKNKNKRKNNNQNIGNGKLNKRTNESQSERKNCVSVTKQLTMYQRTTNTD